MINLILELSKDISYSNICVAFSHEHIGQFLKNDKDLEIINIDHHHDLGYDEDDPYEKCTCANWAYYLFKQGKLDKYIWLNNNNSDIIPPPRHEANFFSEFFCDINETSYINRFGRPDKIFICLSPEWVPSQYHPLDLLNKQNDYTLPVYG